jgi:glycolate oxidase FAD binding subunit
VNPPACQSTTTIPLGDGRAAVAVDRPATIEALREGVARRAGEGLALYPQGGRTALDYGGTPAKPGVAIDTTALDRVIDYPAADMTITVEAGMTLSALQAVLAEHGQRLPLDAPLPDRATLGGIYATNTSGPRRYGWGRPRDLIIGVSFVTADGELVKGGGRVVKNVAGYDFPRLLTGSMGTLGVLAQLTLKVRPRPEASALVFAPRGDVGGLDATLGRLNTSMARPVAIELLNAPAARQLDPSGALGLAGAPWVIGVGIEDNAASVEWQVARLRDELGGEVVMLRDAESGPFWDALAGLPASGPHAALAFLANLRPSGVAPFVGSLGPEWMIHAHAGSGIVAGQRLGGSADERDVAAEVSRHRAAAVAQGGNLILTRCPAPWKKRLRVWGEPRADWPLMERIRAALDPPGLMNPGRFVGTI